MVMRKEMMCTNPSCLSRTLHTPGSDHRCRGPAILDEVGELRGDVGLRRAIVVSERVGREEILCERSFREPLAAQCIFRYEQCGGHVVEVEADPLCVVYSYVETQC